VKTTPQVNLHDVMFRSKLERLKVKDTIKIR